MLTDKELIERNSDRDFIARAHSTGFKWAVFSQGREDNWLLTAIDVLEPKLEFRPGNRWLTYRSVDLDTVF